jgi:hypothetical protein
VAGATTGAAADAGVAAPDAVPAIAGGASFGVTVASTDANDTYTASEAGGDDASNGSWTSRGRTRGRRGTAERGGVPVVAAAFTGGLAPSPPGSTRFFRDPGAVNGSTSASPNSSGPSPNVNADSNGSTDGSSSGGPGSAGGGTNATNAGSGDGLNNTFITGSPVVQPPADFPPSMGGGGSGSGSGGLAGVLTEAWKTTPEYRAVQQCPDGVAIGVGGACCAGEHSAVL